MPEIVGTLIVYLVLQTILLAVGVGVGLALHWCVPGLTVDMGVLVGVLSTIASAYFLARMTRARYLDMIEDSLADQEDEEQDEDLSELSFAFRPPAKRRPRKSKRS